MPVPSLFAAASDQLLAARLQMAGTLMFHAVLASFGVGMPALLLAAESRYLRTHDPEYRELARRWSKTFAVLFAVGAVSGTVLSFELGILWPKFMRVFGPAIGLPFTFEGFAFFLEGIFVGVYLYGWERLSPRIHWLCGWPIAIAGVASAAFVVSANAWINAPGGFRFEGGKLVEVDPWQAMFGPTAPAQAAHVIVASFMVTGFAVAGFHAWRLARGTVNVSYHRKAMSLAAPVAAVATLAQLVIGDWSGHVVAETQPVKLAALEGQFETEAGASLRIGGWPDPDAHRTRYALKIPSGLSMLAYHDPHATVRGLDEFPAADQPPVLIVHLAFQAMVGIGSALAALAAWALVHRARRGSLPETRGFLFALAAAGPLSIVAMEAGWIVTEVGRQPWIVQGLMRTSDAVTDSPYVHASLAVAVLVYLSLAAGTFGALRLLARRPMGGEPRHGA